MLAVLTGRVRYEALAKSAIFIPMAISFVAAAVIWRFMYEFNADIGTANAVTTQLGGEPTAWLQDKHSPLSFITDYSSASSPLTVTRQPPRPAERSRAEANWELSSMLTTQAPPPASPRTTAGRRPPSVSRR